MNKQMIALVLLFASLAVCSFGQSMSTANEVAPMPVVTSPVIKFFSNAEIEAVGSEALILAATGATQLKTLPAGTKGVVVVVGANACNFGNASISTGVGYPMIATASFKEFFVPAHKSSIGLYFCPRDPNATQTIRVYPYK